jgi:hypothetical protein
MKMDTEYKVEYQCEHIGDLIEHHSLDAVTIEDDGLKREGILVLHQLYKNSDGYMTTRERDQLIEIKYCPLCGKSVDKKQEAEKRASDQDARIAERRKHVEELKLSWCPFCDKGVIPVAVPTKYRRHFLYTCPFCGGSIRKGMTRRISDRISGVMQGPGRKNVPY